MSFRMLKSSRWDFYQTILGRQGGRGSGKGRAAPLLPVVGGTSSLFIPTWEVCCGLQEHGAISVTVSTNVHARSEASLQSLCPAHTHRAKVTPRPEESESFPYLWCQILQESKSVAQTYRVRVSTAAAEGGIC